MTDPTDDDDIDRAYSRAVDLTADASAAQRRRAAVLAAIAARDATQETPVEAQRAAPADRAAANDAHPHSSAGWWRGLAAACVIGASALVVVRMQQAPDAPVASGTRWDAGRVAAPAAESTATQIAAAAPRQPAVPTAPTPATAPLADAPRRAPIAPAAAPAATGSVTAAQPAEKTARPAFAADRAATEVSAGRIATSGAAADAAVVARAPVSSLLIAVNQGDIEAARTILQTTEPDAERDADGRTALAIAVLRAHVPLVELLLARGANRLAVDRFGRTPVSYAHASADTALLQAFAKP